MGKAGSGLSNAIHKAMTKILTSKSRAGKSRIFLGKKERAADRKSQLSMEEGGTDRQGGKSRYSLGPEARQNTTQEFPATRDHRQGPKRPARFAGCALGPHTELQPKQTGRGPSTEEPGSGQATENWSTARWGKTDCREVGTPPKPSSAIHLPHRGGT